ncbi:mevalonate kinase [Methanococcoides methylutens]|uniref:mevalonate kinase n=1 Tax=Methanococcoides methylutens TaxID=2226 RepID=UPI004044A59C
MLVSLWNDVPHKGALKMITCSAPGKVYLFGEHAVVYGEPAICCAVDIRTRVSVDHADSITIRSTLGTTGIDFETHPYVSAVVERFQDISSLEGVSILISSEIPVGSGLGSSAAVTIATIKALDMLLGTGLELDDIARMGHEVEQRVQGAASQTDTYVCTMGGVVMIPQRKGLDLIDCGIIVGNTNIFSSTKELVANVSDLNKRFPDVIGPILSSIGMMSVAGKGLVNTKDYVSIGKLMNINQGLLDAIGVGCSELSSFTYAARNSGAYGAKITGAGGGGCMVAIAPHERVDDVAAAIGAAGGEVIVTKATDVGVKVESL